MREYINVRDASIAAPVAQNSLSSSSFIRFGPVSHLFSKAKSSRRFFKKFVISTI
jgi:hypothetical protein